MVESGENTIVTEDRVYRELIADNIETSGSDYWRMNKNVEQKSPNLERIIQTFSSPIKQNVCRIVLKEVNDFKNLLHDGLINYLQNLWLKKNSQSFIELCIKFVGIKSVDDSKFLNWLSTKFNIRAHHFIANKRKKRL